VLDGGLLADGLVEHDRRGCHRYPDEVIDDGPGIPAFERERVFGRFVRLDPGRGHAGGSSGLGLAIAREIAAAHGATIILAEAEGGGTRAVVTFAGLAKQRLRSE
jgi:signal transduction histidine kinase